MVVYTVAGSIKIETAADSDTMPEQPDTTGRLLLDYIADIPGASPTKLGEVYRAFIALHARGHRYTEWSIDAAIRTGNHRLLRWLMTRAVRLAPEKFTWCAVHSRNRFALRYTLLTAEHFEQVALEADTAFLGAMLQWHRQLGGVVPELSVRPFLALLDGYKPDELLQTDDVERARVGFRWLLRNHMIDLDTINFYHTEQIAAVYGDRVRLLLSP